MWERISFENRSEVPKAAEKQFKKRIKEASNSSSGGKSKLNLKDCSMDDKKVNLLALILTIPAKLALSSLPQLSYLIKAMAAKPIIAKLELGGANDITIQVSIRACPPGLYVIIMCVIQALM